MHESVCVYVWNSVLKGQNVLSIPFLFYSLFTGIGQNWVKFWGKGGDDLMPLNLQSQESSWGL